MRVLYFARAREIAGVKCESRPELANTTVAGVLEELCLCFGDEFAALVERSTVMADDEIVVRADFGSRKVERELAILPPVSGGDGPTEAHGPLRRLRVGILTVSDRASAGEYQDLTGPALKEMVLEYLDADIAESMIVPDSMEQILSVITGWCDDKHLDLVITNGGTGLAERDVTPQAVRSILDVEAPGLGEMMRSAGIAKTPLAALSRQIAGRRGTSIVVAVPGSVKGACESLEAILDVIPHACSLAAGDVGSPSNNHASGALHGH